MLYNILCNTEKRVRSQIIKILKKEDIPFRVDAGYIVTTLPGRMPLICTHTDTIDTLYPMASEIVKKGNILSLGKKSISRCLGADDRAGVWIALKMIQGGTATPFNYAFFSGEEKGCIGSTLFANTEDLDEYTCFIGLDRASRDGQQNCAIYGYDNDLLTSIFSDAGYVTSSGSYTDCSNLASNTDIACINLSIGYQHEHSTKETLNLALMEDTLDVMQSVIIPAGQPFIAKPIIQWDRRFWEHPIDSISKPLCCDNCGEHTLLYEQEDGSVLCSICETVAAKY